MANLTQHNKERSAVEAIVDALLAVYLPVADITKADELLTTSTICERLQEVMPFEIDAMDVNEALNQSGFHIHNAGQMDLRWMMQAR